MYGNLKALQELINLGCDVNQSTFSGRTALMGAAQMGHIHVAKCLLSSGCSSNARSLKGGSAMHFAVCPMNEPADDPPGMIRVLLAAGASATAVDLLGNTALHLLDDSRFGSDATGTKIRLLVEAGADINARNNDGGSALFRAIRRNQPQVVSCLLNAGAATENYRQLGGSLLHDAALYAGLEVLRCLEGMKTSRMKADVLDAEGDSPWDCFIYVLKLPEWELGSLRKPEQEEKEYFVSLYRTIRDRDLQLDIDRLEWTRRYLVDKDARAASALEQLVQENETLGQWSLVRTFKTIALQVREKMWDAAVEAVEENIDLLQARMNQSPWLQTSRYDYMGSMELDHKR
ncbi:Fibronectin type 3 and ankyrin repeat domains 1 protein [Colletotrichum siamense]|uniref:Fibronectin type 3 and ankyrin repeat domains 1 protein n=1 Tax=Colletotrichum siamense TaxID=690259 RepID=UPI00187274D6|nr:Fibronectin type 3 and ankyrin repeat domains 1 protein [Colletotrichum siamense]KAF5484821.1 Fibronectin type 3 and ankyrin repeat domains 1 protein [Colletotrichum siamense]